MKKTEKNICFTGIGARNKDGNHTEKEFLSIMDKEYKKPCKRFRDKNKTCKNACNPYKKLHKKIINRFIKNLDNNIDDKKLIRKYNNKCNKCTNKTRKCNTKEYMKYSGAINGKCPKSRKDILDKVWSIVKGK